VKPAAVSASDGSFALVSERVNGKPAKLETGGANVAVGATLRTVTAT